MLYVVGALFAVRTLRLDWLIDKAIAQISMKPMEDREELIFGAAMAMLYGVAGVALLFLSRWAVIVLAVGLILQAVLFVRIWVREKRGPTRASVNACGLSVAALTVALLGERAGVFT